jgi:hypothetical protein
VIESLVEGRREGEEEIDFDKSCVNCEVDACLRLREFELAHVGREEGASVEEEKVFNRDENADKEIEDSSGVVRSLRKRGTEDRSTWREDDASSSSCQTEGRSSIRRVKNEEKGGWARRSDQG